MRFWPENFDRKLASYYWREISLIFIFAFMLMIIVIYHSVSVIRIVSRQWMPSFALQQQAVMQTKKSNLANMHLFGSEEVSPEAEIPVILKGIILGQGATSNLAIINVNGQEAVYHEGDKITDNMSVEKVLFDRVILLNKSVTKTLVIPKDEKTDSTMIPTINNVD